MTKRKPKVLKTQEHPLSSDPAAPARLPAEAWPVMWAKVLARRRRKEGPDGEWIRLLTAKAADFSAKVDRLNMPTPADVVSLQRLLAVASVLERKSPDLNIGLLNELTSAANNLHKATVALAMLLNQDSAALLAEVRNGESPAWLRFRVAAKLQAARAAKDAAPGGAKARAAKRGPTPKAKPKVRRLPPLTDQAAAVLEILKALSTGRAMTGPRILDALAERDPPLYPDQSVLTGRIIPALKPYGVRNKPRVGYFLQS